MASKSEGTKGGDSPAESEVSDRAMPLLSPQGAFGPSGSGARADASQPNPKVVTEEVLLNSLKDMRRSMGEMIAAAMRGSKRNRSPSPVRGPSEEEVLSSGELDLLDRDQVGSGIEDPDTEESGAVSLRESWWIQGLTDLVHRAFNLPVPDLQVSTVSALGSLRAPQSSAVFPIHPLLEGVLFQEWNKPDKVFFPPKKFSVLYPMEEKFSKRWASPAVDAAISCVNKSLTCPVENVQVFKDPVDRRLEALLKNSFTSAGAVVQPAVAAIGVAQALSDQFKQMLELIPAEQAEEFSDVPKAICFTVDAIKDSIQQASRLSLSLIHMRRLLWLKNWEAEPPCKKLLAGFPFHGGRLFGEDLDKYIQTISSGKSTLLPTKKKVQGPAFKRQSSPGQGPSNAKQYRRPPARTNFGFNSRSQGQAVRGKRQWFRKPAKPAPKSTL